MSGRPGSNSRGRGGKRKNFKRGGGHNFSRVEVYNAAGDIVSPWSEDAILDRDAQEDGTSSSDLGSSSDGGGPSSGPAYIQEEHPGPQLGSSIVSAGSMSREEARLAKKARKEAAKRKAAARNVQVGDLPPSSDSESDDGMGENEKEEFREDGQKHNTPPPPSAKPRGGSILKNRGDSFLDGRSSKLTGHQAKDPGSGSDSDSDRDSEGDDSEADAALSTALGKKVSLAQNAVDEVEAKRAARQRGGVEEEANSEMERLRKIREQREQREQFLLAEKEETAEKNRERKERTEALLRKAHENKNRAKGAKRGGSKGKK